MSSVNSISSGFSFNRVWNFAIYYMPRLKRQLLIYFCVSLLGAILCLLPGPEGVQKRLTVGVWAIIPILFYCGSLVFSKGPDTRIFERLMPISAAEKLTFFYIYSLIILPIVIYLLPTVAGWIYISTPSLQNPAVVSLYKIKFHYGGVILIINALGGILIAVSCLYGVMASRQNRMLFGFVGVVVSNIIVGVLGGIVGIFTAVNTFGKGFGDGYVGREPDPEQVGELIVKTMLEDMSQYNALTISMICVSVVLIMTVVCLTYRSLKRQNI